MQMKCRAKRRSTHWRIEKVVQHLCRRSHHYDFVLKKSAIGIIGMPEFRIENFVERARLKRVQRSKANHVTTKIRREIIWMADLRQCARRKRFVNLFARVRRQARELAIRHAIRHSADLPVDRVGPKIY